MLTVLRNRSFAAMWLGQVCSNIGNHLYLVAIAWWVLQTYESSTLLGLLLLCHTIPAIIFGLFGGVLADRWLGARIMWWCDIARALCIGLMAALAAVGMLSIWILLLVNVALGIAESLFDPAYSTVIPGVVPANDLDGANAITAVSVDMAAVIGPLLAGWAIAQWGVVPAFWLNSGSFMIAAMCIIPIARRHTRHAAPLYEPVFGAIRHGFVVVRRIPWIWRGLILTSVVNFGTTGPLFITMPSLFQERNLGVTAYSWMLTIVAGGSVIAAIGIGQVAKRIAPHNFIYFGLSLLGIGTLMFASAALPMIYIGAALYGVGVLIANVVWIGALQRNVSSDVLGRVTSIDRVLSLTFMPASFALAGILTDIVGSVPVLVAGGVLTLLAIGFAIPQTTMHIPDTSEQTT